MIFLRVEQISREIIKWVRTSWIMNYLTLVFFESWIVWVWFFYELTQKNPFNIARRQYGRFHDSLHCRRLSLQFPFSLVNVTWRFASHEGNKTSAIAIVTRNTRLKLVTYTPNQKAKQNHHHRVQFCLPTYKKVGEQNHEGKKNYLSNFKQFILRHPYVD